MDFDVAGRLQGKRWVIPRQLIAAPSRRSSAPALVLLLIFAARGSLGAAGMVGDEATLRYSGSGGSLRVHAMDFVYFHRVPILESVQGTAGFGYRRTQLDSDDSGGAGPLPAATAPLPAFLHALQLRLSLEWLFHPKAWVFIHANPGLYGDDERDSGGAGAWDRKDFNAPSNVQFNYLARPGLRWIAGLSVDPFRKDAFLPMGGVIWRVNERWNLRAAIPTFRMEYRAIETGRGYLDLHAGAAFDGATYRARGEKLNHQETFLGPGLVWFHGGFRLDVSGGWLLTRRFEYEATGANVKSGGVPAINAQASARF